MFINCPNCSALVATDLATDLPPERCPRCGFGPLAEPPEQASAPVPAPEPEPEQVAPPAPPTPLFIPLKPSRPAATAAQAPPPIAPGTGAATAEADPATAPADAAPTAETAPTAAQQVPETEAATEASGASGADAPEPVDPAPGPTPGRPAPRFARGRHAGTIARPGWRPVTAAAALAVLLAAQLLLADRARLAADPGWRPLVAGLCGALGCSLPHWREPDAIVVQQRDVRPLPERPQVLRVSATLRNDARWAQAWPRLTLTLSDVDGRALGMRTFEPAEYLVTPPPDITLSSGQSADIRMDIVEPSPHAVAFNFRFD